MNETAGGAISDEELYGLRDDEDCAARGPLTGQACALPTGHRGDHRTADGLGGWHNNAR